MKNILPLILLIWLTACNSSEVKEPENISSETSDENNYTPYTLVKECTSGRTIYRLDTGELASWNSAWEGGAWEKLDPETTINTVCAER